MLSLGSVLGIGCFRECAGVSEVGLMREGRGGRPEGEDGRARPYGAHGALLGFGERQGEQRSGGRMPSSRGALMRAPRKPMPFIPPDAAPEAPEGVAG